MVKNQPFHAGPFYAGPFNAGPYNATIPKIMPIRAGVKKADKVYKIV